MHGSELWTPGQIASSLRVNLDPQQLWVWAKSQESDFSSAICEWEGIAASISNVSSGSELVLCVNAVSLCKRYRNEGEALFGFTVNRKVSWNFPVCRQLEMRRP